MAVVNRFTGRPKIFAEFRKHCYPNETEFLLPRRREVAAYLHFVSKMKWHKCQFNAQHGESIPRDLKVYPHVFENFLTKLAEATGSILGRVRESPDRASCVKCLRDNLSAILDSCKTQFLERGNRSSSKLEFLSHQVISDLEEVYVQPFGAVTASSVVMGYGAHQGYGIVFGDTDPSVEEVCSNMEQISSFLVGRIKETNELPSSLGLFFSGTEDDSCLVRLNARPFNFVDIEHILCKVYVGAAKTVGCRSNSLNPKTSRSGYHPVKFDDYEIPWDDNNIAEIMRHVVDAHDLLGPTYHTTPNTFLFREEHDRNNQDINY